jgi:thiamine-monophosphate kinase
MPVSSAASGGTLADVGEFGLIDSLIADLPMVPEVLIGPGDDAAALDLASPVLSSVDVLVEGVHFRRDWSEPDAIGRRAVAVNVADIEAMGGRAVALLVGFSAPGELAATWALQFARGLKAEAATAGVSLVGGDVTRARDITIAVTALGVLDGLQPVRRNGARPGDVVALAGRVGWAAAGLTVLGRGFRSPRVVVEAYRVPQVPYGAGATAARAGAHAMIDVSDGLLADLGHLASDSGVVIEISRTAFEVPEPLQAVAAATGTDPYELILTGGDDHALAATFGSADAVPEGWLVIGSVRARSEEETPSVLVDGGPWEPAAGYDHFRARRS